MKLEPAYVALGSNLSDPEKQIGTAIEELAMLPDTRLARVSSLYKSAPVGFGDQPDYTNAVAQVETALTPRALLDALLAIERRHGRKRDFRNAPRTLDLDLLLYAQRTVNEPDLTVPHPRMHGRAFVIVPLCEIAADVTIPGRGRARDLLSGIDVATVTRLEPSEE